MKHMANACKGLLISAAGCGGVKKCRWLDVSGRWNKRFFCGCFLRVSGTLYLVLDSSNWKEWWRRCEGSSVITVAEMLPTINKQGPQQSLVRLLQEEEEEKEVAAV